MEKSDNGKVIEIPKKDVKVVEPKSYLVTEEERNIIIQICDVANKSLGIQSIPAISKILAKFA